MTEKEFSGLFNKWFDPVRKYLFYRCGDPDLATDIAQDAFVRVWEKGRPADEKMAAGLVYKIARDLLISYYRKEKVKQEYQGQFSVAGTEASPEENLLFQELMGKYNDLLARMPEKQRTVFLLSRVDELKYAEIALRMGISVKAVEKRMTLALKLIRQELHAYGKH